MKELTIRTILAVILFLSIRDSVILIERAEEFADRVDDLVSAEYVTPTVTPTVPAEAPEEAVDIFVEDVNNSEAPPVVEGPWYTEEQHEILAIIIYQEAGGDKCSDDTRRKVGSVFLNRVNSPLFPDTFEEVALGHRQYGTLYLTGIKWPDRASLPQEAHAVQRAWDIAEELLENGSILPDNVIWQAEFKQGDGEYCEQMDFIFAIQR